MRGKAERALAALREVQPDAAHLSVERDILPKLEVRAGTACTGCTGCRLLGLLGCCKQRACQPGGELLLPSACPRLPTSAPLHPTHRRLQLLEGLSPGLGWKVFRDYPEQFASPDAVECWRMLAAYLFTIGIEPEQVGRVGKGGGKSHPLTGCCLSSRMHAACQACATGWRPQMPGCSASSCWLSFIGAALCLLPQITLLFTRHHVLFRHAVARPDALRRLFTWLQRDLDLPPASIMRLLHRCPTVLQVRRGGVRVGWGVVRGGRASRCMSHPMHQFLRHPALSPRSWMWMRC